MNQARCVKISIIEYYFSGGIIVKKKKKLVIKSKQMFSMRFVLLIIDLCTEDEAGASTHIDSLGPHRTSS